MKLLFLQYSNLKINIKFIIKLLYSLYVLLNHIRSILFELKCLTMQIIKSFLLGHSSNNSDSLCLYQLIYLILYLLGDLRGSLIHHCKLRLLVQNPSNLNSLLLSTRKNLKPIPNSLIGILLLKIRNVQLIKDLVKNHISLTISYLGIGQYIPK